MLPCPPGTTWVRELGRGAELSASLVVFAGTTCVLKRVRDDLAEGAPAAHAEAALLRDAEALRLLGGRGAPRLLDVGHDTAGAFTLQTYAAGGSLGSWLEHRDRLEAARLSLRLVDLVTSLHALADARGPLALAHGDLAPDHVIIGDDELTAIDFGASSWRDAPAPSAHRGTLPFVAPELLRGEAPSGPATDRYAAGVLVATLFAGRPPLRAGESGARLLEIGQRGHDLAAVSGGIPGAVSRALADVLAFAPEDRAPDLAPLRAALSAAGGA